MASSALGFYWGDYVHPPGEVQPARIHSRALRNSRNQKWATEHRMIIQGEFLNADGTPLDQSQISDRIEELEYEYSQDYRDCGFLIGNVRTPHWIRNRHPRNLSGNIVVEKSWDNRLPIEYATTRSFWIVIQATFLEVTSGVIDFGETVSRFGGGGPDWKLYNTVTGPERVDITPLTKVTHVQRGFVVGAVNQISPPPPIWPLELKSKLTQIVYSNPVYSGSPLIRSPHSFRTDYTYHFERLGATPFTPNNWYPS